MFTQWVYTRVYTISFTSQLFLSLSPPSPPPPPPPPPPPSVYSPAGACYQSVQSCGGRGQQLPLLPERRPHLPHRQVSCMQYVVYKISYSNAIHCYMYTSIHERKKEANKVKQINKAKQHSTPTAVIFPKKSCLGWDSNPRHSILYICMYCIHSIGLSLSAQKCDCCIIHMMRPAIGILHNSDFGFIL